MKLKKLDYGFTDSYMFCTLMQDPRICAWLIGKILPGKEIEDVRLGSSGMTDLESEVEKTLIFNPSRKSVRLDVLFKSEDEYYDIEMQCSGSPDLPLRSRFYSSQLDMEMLKKGQQYNRLAQKYVIFICTFDPMGLNMPVYKFEMTEQYLLAETKDVLPLGDKSCTIFLNTRCNSENVPDSLREFFDFVQERERDYSDGMYAEIEERMVEYNEPDSLWRRGKMTFEQEIQLAAEAARKQEAKNIAAALIRKGMNHDEVAEVTGLSPEEIKKLDA